MRLRPWRPEDAEALRAIADDEDVARFMTTRFPHPYTLEDARYWTSSQGDPGLGVNFAIEAGGDLAGGTGYQGLAHERVRTAVVGYWLGRAFWGRGIATAALRGVSERAFATGAFDRLESTVFAPNAASMRVLEKAGYQREGVMRRAYFKHGQIYDGVLFALVRP